MSNVFKYKGKELFEILNDINSYNISFERSLKRSIRNFNVDDVYSEVLNYISEQDDKITRLTYYINEIENENINISYRIKSEQSFREKWQRNVIHNREFEKVCNDIIGIRIIADATIDEIKLELEECLNLNSNYKIEMIDFHESPKSKDDGYRGIHLYFKNNPKSFPIEIQIWNQSDALLNFYTHDIIYKKFNNKYSEFTFKLREWLDKIPDTPDEIEIDFIKYLYKFVYEKQ